MIDHEANKKVITEILSKDTKVMEALLKSMDEFANGQSDQKIGLKESSNVEDLDTGAEDVKSKMKKAAKKLRNIQRET
jgi:hypothetical protein